MISTSPSRRSTLIETSCGWRCSERSTVAPPTLSPRIWTACRNSGRRGRAKGVVVRPDRAVVVRHRVVAQLRSGDGTDAPAGEGLLVEQRASRAQGVLGAGDAREERVARVRGAHEARPLQAVQGQDVGA